MSSSDHTPTNTPQPSPTTTPSPCATCGKRGETSPIVSDAKKPKLDDNPMTIEIDKFLECSVCLDFPASPIQTCANAHFLCGQCAPKFRACPTCKNSKLWPSPACEKLAKEANMKIECVNLEAGCKEGILSTKFAEHLSLCYFREIRCDFTATCGVKVKFHEYSKHLEDAHKRKAVTGPQINATCPYTEKHAKSGNVLFQFAHTAVKFGSHEFILQKQVSKQTRLFYCWACVLGDKDLADKYFCEVKFKSLNAFGCTWKLPVLPFHEIPSNVSEAKLFEYSGGSAVAVVPMAALTKWGVSKEDTFPIVFAYEIKEA